jgi:hypothetical protein
MNWYYSKNNQQFGPINIDTIRSLYATGQLSPNDLVWTEGMNQWLAASNIPAITGGHMAPPASPFQPQPQPPRQMHYAGYNLQPQSSGKAIASLVLGILSMACCFPPVMVLGIIGLILGIIALNDMKREPALGGKGLATAGIILSILGILLCAFFALVIILDPNFGNRM